MQKVQKALKPILEVQEFDMQMLQLMRLKRERQKELENLKNIKIDLQHKCAIKQGEIIEIKKDIRIIEGEIEEISQKLKKLESQQGQIKKVEEFNALSQEMSQLERERVAKEQKSSDLHDKLSSEEELLKTFTSNLNVSVENSKVLEEEIRESIKQINTEGQNLQVKREELAKQTDSEMFAIYERLLNNKHDRVIVPIENRTCSGCHISITAQDENLVRKGERLVFCEHCSRIHYWPESVALEGAETTQKPRRRRKATAT